MRYVVRRQPTASWSYDPQPLTPHLNVDGRVEVDTGLVDEHGHKIMRVPSPIGFGRDTEH